MDVARDPAILKRRRLRQALLAAVGVIIVGAISIVLARMEPAAPTVERATLLLDTVRRGPLVREVRGLGTLVPEDTRWIPAVTDGRIERILLRPGAQVTADSVILELANPQVAQDAFTANLQLQSAEATLQNLRAQVQSEVLTQEAAMAAVNSEYSQAQLQAETDEALAKEKLVSALELRKSQMRAAALKTRVDIEGKRLTSANDSISARLRVQQAAVDSARALTAMQATRVASLRVRPGFAGVLQQVPVEVGQTIGPGTNLARVADPARLKAELKIAETQAKDIEIGQPAQIDTRNGIIRGVVSRKDPAAVSGTVSIDVTLTDPLPRGAVPDLSVDGTIQLERLDNAIQVGRFAFGQDQSTISIFKLTGTDGHAQRVQVKVGRSSVNAIEILSGLQPGDEVILSDMSAWDSVDRVRLR